jgi:hypothetical protein
VNTGVDEIFASWLATCPVDIVWLETGYVHTLPRLYVGELPILLPARNSAAVRAHSMLGYEISYAKCAATMRCPYRRQRGGIKYNRMLEDEARDRARKGESMKTPKIRFLG